MAELKVPEQETLCCVICGHVEQPGEARALVTVAGEEWDECPVCGNVDTGGCPSYLQYGVLPEWERIELLESIINQNEETQ